MPLPGSEPLAAEPGQAPSASQKYHVRFLAVVGLALCVCVNCWDLLNILQDIINPFDQLTEVYVALAGVVCLSLEGVDQLAGGAGRSWIIARFPFLNTMRGRGATYFVMGTLTASGGSLMPILGILQLASGCLLTVVGVAQMIIGCCSKVPEEHLTDRTNAASGSQAEGRVRYGRLPVRWVAAVVLALCVWVNAWDLKKFLSKNPFSLSGLMSGELAHPFEQLIHIYLVLGSTACFALEFVDLILFGKGRACLISFFPFLSKAAGRGVAYFAMGSLTAAQGFGGIELGKLFDWEEHLLGLLELFVGLGLMVLGVILAFLASSDHQEETEAGHGKPAE